MKLVIDFQGAQACNSQRGIGNYCKAIISEICMGYSCEIDIHILINGAFLPEGLALKNSFNTMIPMSNFHIFFPCTQRSGQYMSFAERERTEVVREALLDRIGPDMVLITSLFEGMVDNAVVNVKKPSSKYKTAVILYDLIPLLYPDLYLANKKSKVWYEKCIHQLKRADCVLTISDYTKSTVEKHLDVSKEKIFNISGAVDHNFFNPSTHSIRQNYIFSVSGMDPRKNLSFLIEAFAKSTQLLKSDYQLIITCHITKVATAELKVLIKNLKLGDDQVVFTGFVSDKDILNLYRGCRLFVFPSWQEGFGLPVLEAMACGAPVLAADAASLPEIGGGSLIYFDPFDSQDLASKIVSSLTQPNLLLNQSVANLKRAKSFQWSKVAKTTVEALKKRLMELPKKKINTNKSIKKPNLAYFSPMPPDKSGVADYSEILSQELTKYYDVIVIVSPKDKKLDWTKALKCQSIENFLANPGCFDRVLYHFGNSHFHVEMFDYLPANPGVVVLHDFFLGGVIGIRPDQFSLIYRNHGYRAIKKIVETTDSEFLKDHPANLSVFQNSHGVIVHSNYAESLIKKWYGNLALEKSSVVPLFRSEAIKLSRKQGRKKLKINPNQFVVASFGHLGPNKLNDRLLDVWLTSPLSKSCRLIFVGQAGNSEFDSELLNKIKKNKDKVQVSCTGWISKEDYLAWLCSVDIAVQLRADTRGETSAAALDCLSYSVPTVVNAHGDLASIPKNAVLMIEDIFSDFELQEAIEKLYFDVKCRSELSKKGSEYAANKHDLKNCALAYYHAIENFYDSKSPDIEEIFRHLKDNNNLPSLYLDKLNLIKSLAASFDTAPRVKKYFIDVSELVNRDIRTGIQRVVRNILRCFLLDPPSGYLIEPVYATNETMGYRRATKFIQRFLDLPHICDDELIDPEKGDIFLGLDLQPKVVVNQKKYLDMMYLKGVSIHFLVYDLIPVNYPEFFPEGAKSAFDKWLGAITNYDQLICISESTKNDIEQWLENNFPNRLKIIARNTISLSSELSQEDKTTGDPKNAWFVRNTLEHCDVFLMVGTLEPRKEHAQVLDAFELLWAENKDKKLLIVGKIGWCVENLSKRIKNHRQFNKNLLWLEDCSDEFLLELYSSCTGLIAASWAEGFGLPLIEAHKYGLPVFCRDIPVFREVAAKFATFFSGSDPQLFLNQFIEWQLSVKAAVIAKSEPVTSICWKKATKEIEKITVKND